MSLDDDPIVRTIIASDGTIIDSDGTDTHTRVWFDLHESGNVTWSTR